MATLDAVQHTPSVTGESKRSRAHTWGKVKRGWQLYVKLLLPLAWLLIFQYWPMYGAQIAFRNYLPGASIWDSPWVGLDNFIKFFNSYMFWRVIRNTLVISFYSLLVGFPIPILFALALNQLRRGWFKGTLQMVSYAPNFISTVVIVGMIIQFLDLRRGPVNLLLQGLGLQPVNFMGSPEWFSSIYVWSGIWQYTGFSAIIYLAALSTVDQALHEAAAVDGATRLQRIWHIDLPAILPTAMTLLILNMGQLMNVGFEKVFLLQNTLNQTNSEVISTYVYKVSLAAGIASYSYGAAIGLFNSMIGLVLIVMANRISKKLTETGLW
jgi:multiple sugar transport system permease protein/putative aldouronate transport system permease protein